MRGQEDERRPAAPSGAADAPPPEPSREPALHTCPNCGRRLAGRSCKLVCPDPACGFFLSCSDYL